MSDLIDRKELLQKIRDAENHAFNGYFKGLVKAHNIIADMTPEQKTGKWIKTDETGWFGKCSECGTVTDYDFPYCPYCGTKMRGEHE